MKVDTRLQVGNRLIEVYSSPSHPGYYVFFPPIERDDTALLTALHALAEKQFGAPIEPTLTISRDTPEEQKLRALAVGNPADPSHQVKVALWKDSVTGEPFAAYLTRTNWGYPVRLN